MYTNDRPDTAAIMMFNVCGVIAAHALLSLVNFVKYRFDNQAHVDRINRIEKARNEKLLEDYVGDPKTGT